MKQLSLIKKPDVFHGGELKRGKRKIQRPLSSKNPIHLVLKSELKNLFQYRVEIEELIQKMTARFHITCYRFSVNHDHIHLIIRIPDRAQYVKFIRALPGTLAKRFKIKWTLLPFTRVMSWGKDFRSQLGYLTKNSEEAEGLLQYEQRQNWYARHLRSRVAKYMVNLRVESSRKAKSFHAA